MELVAANLSEGNASGPEPPAAEPPPLAGLGVENFVTLAVFGLIFALGVLGNCLVITVLARSGPGKRRSTTNLFILNLSIADLAYLLFCIPFQATVYALPTWVLGAFICKFTHYFFTVSMLVSIFTLAAMSVDRYVAIVHSRRSSSLRVSRNALLGVGCIWALSVAMASPVAYHQRLFHRDASNQTFCWEQWPDQRHKKAYVLCTFVFGYLLPLLLICFCYAKVLNHLHKKLKNMSKKSEASKKKVNSVPATSPLTTHSASVLGCPRMPVPVTLPFLGDPTRHQGADGGSTRPGDVCLGFCVIVVQMEDVAFGWARENKAF
ncbi:Galanin receptor type 1 [Pteropus alecto]|uniref:Galanin receptor type 1 n=1 Tax=Pteropus alecto TaxID=9402 RepID=L5KHI0_PTEAL|nr:Galanin receptor type 1 [Pteropus alecto]